MPLFMTSDLAPWKHVLMEGTHAHTHTKIARSQVTLKRTGKRKTMCLMNNMHQSQRERWNERSNKVPEVKYPPKYFKPISSLTEVLKPISASSEALLKYKVSEASLCKTRRESTYTESGKKICHSDCVIKSEKPSLVGKSPTFSVTLAMDSWQRVLIIFPRVGGVASNGGRT